MQPRSATRRTCSAYAAVRSVQNWLELRVDGLVDRGPAAAVVDHVGRGDGQLRDLVTLGDGLQELEGVAEDRVAQADPVVDAQRGRLEVEVAALVVEVHGQLLVGRVDALELVDEVHVPRRAPELAVGRRTHSCLALERDDVADGGVLDLAQPVVVELARPVSGPGVEEVGRPEQAPDVVGAERRKRSGCHVSERTPAPIPTRSAFRPAKPTLFRTRKPSVRNPP